jgi:hypothetical protein
MTNSNKDIEQKPGQAAIKMASFSEIPSSIGPSDNTPMKQIAEVSAAQAIQTFMLLEARAKSETAELQKRLIMQQFRPSKFYPVLVYHDGLRWVCEYAASQHKFQDSQGDAACAYGMSPEEAMQNFDKLWIGATDEDDLEDEDEDEDGDEDGDV